MRHPRLPLAFSLACAAFVILAVSSSASAQTFGKNKVQYTPLDWAVLETPHLRFHYYAEEESLARRLVAVAESVCVEFDARFRSSSASRFLFSLFRAPLLPATIRKADLEGTGGLPSSSSRC